MAFKGNENLRGSRQYIETSDLQLEEIAKCSLDPIYFFRTYIKIVNLDSESLVLFEPRDYQVDFTFKVLNNRNTIAKWPRQSGKTTNIAAVILYLILFRDNYRVLLIAHLHNKAKEILAQIKEMYEFLPLWIQRGIMRFGATGIRLSNGSLVNTAGTSGSSGRGGTYNLLYLDEFAHVQSHLASDFFKSAVPSVSSGKETKIVITSTPKGFNYFYEIWNDSEKGKNDYIRSEIHWSDIPGRDEEWKKKILSSYGAEYFRQEFNSEFLGSSLTLISADKLRNLGSRVKTPIIQNDNLFVYMEPHYSRTYVITVDIGEGIGQDFSVVMCFDITQLPYEVVCIWHSNIITSLQVPGIIYNMAKHYNNAMVMIENASEGAQVANILHYDMEYENVICTLTKKDGQAVSQGFGGHPSRFGVKMSTQVKMIGCQTVKTLIETDRLLVNDYTTVQELLRFTQQGKSFAADDGHDDHVMAMVLFGWFVDQGYIKDVTNTDMRRDIAAEFHNKIVDSASALLVHNDPTPVEIEIEKAREDLWMYPNLIPQKQKDPLMDPEMKALIDKYYR